MLRQHEIQIRVRYRETDAQGRVHHGNYATWFEMGRIELLRAAGRNYRDLERDGVLLVVAELNCQYFAPAEYDDLLTVRTTTVKAKGARIEHHYEISRGEDLIARGQTVVACVSREGKPLRLPPWLQLRESPTANA